jgi:hypothetical protein
MPAWKTTREVTMTGIDPEALERCLRWAAEQLEVSANASAEEVRAAWLRRLPADDFVPSSEARYALHTLLHPQAEDGWRTKAQEAADEQDEERLRGEVEAFAVQFWEVPLGERRQRWQSLAERCAFAPALRARLRQLEAGLDVNARDLSEDARVVELAEHVSELFVLRPGPRARARQAFLRRTRANREEWRTAARRLCCVSPKLAALGKDLLNKIKNARKPVNAGRQAPRGLLALVALIAIVFLVTFIRINNRSRTASDPSFTPDSKENSPFLENHKKISPDVWKNLSKGRPIQDENLKKIMKKIYDDQQMKEDREKQGDHKVKVDGKNP